MSDIIEQTTFATSIKETKPVLTGVNFHLSDNTLCCTATDSYRLAKKTIPFTSSDSFNVTIPSKSLNEVKATMLGDDSEIQIFLNDKKADKQISLLEYIASIPPLINKKTLDGF